MRTPLGGLNAVRELRKKIRGFRRMRKKISPGFVKTGPTPSVNDPSKPSAIRLGTLAKRSGKNEQRITLLISENTGMGLGRGAAASKRALDRHRAIR